MKTWQEVKLEYNQHLVKIKLRQPLRRLSALNKIELFLISNYPSLIKGYSFFTQLEKREFKAKFSEWKGKQLNGAEDQVINDFYKLAE